MTKRIFISYRRDDSAGHAGRVFDRLRTDFGQDVLFMDVDAFPLGANFVRVLGEEVAKCDVLLAIMGPGEPGPRGRILEIIWCLRRLFLGPGSALRCRSSAWPG